MLVAAGWMAFAVVLDAVHEQDDLTLLDHPVLDWLVGQRGPTTTTVLVAITLVAGPTVLPVLTGLVALVWGIVRHEWWRPVLLVGAMITSTALSVVIKGAVARPRPPLATMDVPGLQTTASFPSGHTIGAATLLLVAGYLACRRHRDRRRVVGWAIAALVGTLAVGLSRLYLGYHFLTDVLAAVALAVAVLGAVTILDRLCAEKVSAPRRP